MSLRKTEAPAGTWEAFDEGLSRFGIGTRTGPPQDRLSRHVLPVITLGLAQARSGAGLDQLEPRQRRCIDAGGQAGVVAGDVKAAGPGGAGVLTSYSADARITAELEGLDELERLNEVRERDYEPQLLRIPALLIEAFRLRPLAAGAALVIPFRTASPAVQCGHVYTEAEFFDLVRPLVEAFQQFEEIRP